MIKILVVCICIYAVAKIILKTAAYMISTLWFSREKHRLADVCESNEDLKGEKTKKLRKGGKSWRQDIGRFVSGVNKFVAADISKIPAHVIRNTLYRITLKVDIAENVVIYKGTIFRDGYRCHIGKGTIIGDDNMIDSRGDVWIGDNCNFSTGVKIWTAQHDPQSESFKQVSAPVRIGDRCWISGNVTILPGVNIKDGCVVASGAVVTKDCDEYGIYAGVPAKRIGERSRNLKYEFKGSHNWFL